MGATEQVKLEVRESEGGERERGRNVGEKEEEVKDVEKGEVGDHKQRDFLNPARLEKLNPTNPLRIVINGGTRVISPSPSQASHISTARSTSTLQHSSTTLNSRAYSDRTSLFLFLLHTILALGLVGFLVFKAIQGMMKDSTKRRQKRLLLYFLPQVEAATILSITLAFSWQKAVRQWPNFMVHFILWCSFLTSLSAGILLICFQQAATSGVGVCLIAFSIGNGLYSCWVTHRTSFCSKVLEKSLEPISKFPDLNHPTYWMLGAGFLWTSLWILAVIGALNFFYPPLIIIALVLSLAWTAEVMRNVANITVSRVMALYYLRGMQSHTQFCFQRALTQNLGSASLGSLFVPTIEALKMVARGLNLLEGEDEFMFSCAHCCLNVMQSIFRHGNGWAFVQIAAYGKGFVNASQDSWKLFEKEKMQQIVDSDITSSICLLSGVCSGSICLIVVAPWTAQVHEDFVAAISLLALFIGYLMMRIAMVLPHACVSCYYVCYAENPKNRLFDKTIKDRLAILESDQDPVAPTSRIPRQFRTQP